MVDIIAFLLALAPAAIGTTVLWWGLTRADPSRISTFFISVAAILLSGISALSVVSLIVYYATS